DRFGPPPEPLEALITLTKIRTQAEHAGLTEVTTQADKLKCQRKDGSYVQVAGRFPRLQRKQPMTKLREVLGFLARV
ncbi:MAG: TRCF domain-containing protein, partial [Opitutales bacterium]